MSSLVKAYCETFDRFRSEKEKNALSPEIEDVFEDELQSLWDDMSVEDCKEVEARYPELRVRRL